MKTFEKQFNIKTKLETLDYYVRSILNKFDPDDEIEVDIQEFYGKQLVQEYEDLLNYCKATSGVSLLLIFIH